MPVDFVAHARSLGEVVWESRRKLGDGSVTWFRPGSETRGEDVALCKKVGPYLYDGSAGIALFLAALARVIGGKPWKERANAAIHPARNKFRELLEDSERIARLQLSLGALEGVGSFLYALVVMSDLLQDSSFLEDAQALAVIFSEERIEQDFTYDVVNGSAGALLALLALYRAILRSGDEAAAAEVLKRAKKCGERLLEGKTRAECQPGQAWETVIGNPASPGFSHGSAGIRFALLRLYRITRNSRLRAAAAEALVFESSLYLPAFSTWRDRREEGEMPLPATWCNGGPGIALARAATLDESPHDSSSKIIRAVFRELSTQPLRPVDHLCCGNIGWVEAFLSTALAGGYSDFSEKARELASQVVERAEDGDGFRWRRDPTGNELDPTLFTGASGVGYVFLRMVSPDLLPSLLLIE